MKTNTNKNHYVTFVAVYETMNYNRASDTLGISRQAVSQNLRELGNQLGGIKLFVHDPINRCVTPTSEATAMYPDIKESIEKMLEAEESLRAFTSDSKAVIRAGMPSSMISLIFDDFIQSFNMRFPRVKFEFYSRDSFDLLQQKKLDFIVHFNQIDKILGDNSMKVVDLFEMESIFIASKEFVNTHKLTGEMLTLDELIKLPIIGHAESLREFMNANNVDFTPLAITSGGEPIYAIAKRGIGLGYYYSKFLEKQNNKNEMVVLKVKDCVPIKVKASCYYHKSHITKASKTFIDELKKFCSNRFQ